MKKVTTEICESISLLERWGIPQKPRYLVAEVRDATQVVPWQWQMHCMNSTDWGQVCDAGKQSLPWSIIFKRSTNGHDDADDADDGNDSDQDKEEAEDSLQNH